MGGHTSCGKYYPGAIQQAFDNTKTVTPPERTRVGVYDGDNHSHIGTITGALIGAEIGGVEGAIEGGLLGSLLD